MPAIAHIGLVSPVELGHRDAVTPGAELALGLEAQQPLAPVQGLQGDAGAKDADDAGAGLEHVALCRLARM